MARLGTNLLALAGFGFLALVGTLAYLRDRDYLRHWWRRFRYRLRHRQ